MDDTDILSKYERIRLQNIAEFDALLEENFKEIESASEGLKSLTNTTKRKSSAYKFDSNTDKTFKFTGSIPKERKRSARLAKLDPEYTPQDLEDLDELDENEKPIKSKRFKYNPDYDYSDSVDDLEKIVFQTKKRKSSTSNRSSTVPYCDADKVPEEYIQNIAATSSKIYSANGTSCHQCRQKTIDSKTYCRSGVCVGVRGQFCGPCLLNRYGEVAETVLKDPKWACPPCRKICNCSICRAREGKRPTGILAPIAQRQGHKSVKDFLVSLQGEGDFKDETEDGVLKLDTNKFFKMFKKPDIRKMPKVEPKRVKVKIEPKQIDLSTDLIYNKVKNNDNFYTIGFYNKDDKDYTCQCASVYDLNGDVVGFDNVHTYYRV